MRQDRADLLEIGMEQQVQRMRGHDQVDEVGGEVQDVFEPMV